VLQESLSLASQGHPDEAVASLVVGVRDALRAEDHAWTAQLAKNAALIYAQMRNLAAAAKYYGIALRASAADPSLHLAIADIYQQMGQRPKAARHLKICHSLAVKANDAEILEILEARGYRPEIEPQ
jgi:hypothetical protein